MFSWPRHPKMYEINTWVWHWRPCLPRWALVSEQLLGLAR
jgi:hypothetical protein